MPLFCQIQRTHSVTSREVKQTNMEILPLYQVEVEVQMGVKKCQHNEMGIRAPDHQVTALLLLHEYKPGVCHLKVFYPPGLQRSVPQNVHCLMALLTKLKSWYDIKSRAFSSVRPLPVGGHGSFDVLAVSFFLLLLFLPSLSSDEEE